MTDLAQLQSQLEEMSQGAKDIISNAQTPEQLEQLRLDFLGKKGKLSQILGAMGKLPAPDRPVIGALANDVKVLVQTLLDDRKTTLQRLEIAKN